MIMHYKLISSEIIHEQSWAKYINDTFSYPSGKEGNYYYLETLGGGCSMVVPVLDDGRLILTIQYRYLRDRMSVEFPCGGLKEKESPSDAAKRELLEETGWRADDLMKIGSFDGLNGLAKDTAHVFLAKELTQVSTPQNSEEETTEVIYRRVDEFEDMIKRGEIWDGQTLATWAMSRDYLNKLFN